jgi:hypothetical protein
MRLAHLIHRGDTKDTKSCGNNNLHSTDHGKACGGFLRLFRLDKANIRLVIATVP